MGAIRRNGAARPASETTPTTLVAPAATGMYGPGIQGRVLPAYCPGLADV